MDVQASKRAFASPEASGTLRSLSYSVQAWREKKKKIDAARVEVTV